MRWNQVVHNVADLVDVPRRSTPEMGAGGTQWTAGGAAGRHTSIANLSPVDFERLYTAAADAA